LAGSDHPRAAPLHTGDAHGKATIAARVCADRDGISVEGPEPELVDLSQPALNLRDGKTITCDDDPEEWVRGLAVSFRTPYLSTRVVEDTDPLPDVEIEPTHVQSPDLH
jgi:hypothetical protein